MASILKNMEDTVIKYAEVLSQVLRVDVEIVDNELYRVAGTGMFKERVNKNMGKEGHVYREVMKTGKEQIVMEPGEHPICEHCYKKGNCDETFEISMPIKIEEESIGVIGLVCFTDDQRSHILDNLSLFTEFLEQISDLISSKAKEELEKDKILNMVEILRSILDRVEQGVIIINENNKVENINNMGMEILGLKEPFDSIDYIRETGSEILNLIEFELSAEGEKYTILGEEYKVPQGVSSYDRVYMFTDLHRLETLTTSLSSSIENVGLNSILGRSTVIRELKEKVIKIGKSNSTVLITGESGTGKELFARAIHKESDRRKKPFVAINSSAIPDSLLESELFGYVKGAFTGADPKGKIGKIEYADGGTLFLDEIGDMPLYLQAKLLRVLEEREIIRLGSNESIKVDVRIVAATNKDLEKLIKENMFREDLYYRLNVVPFHILPLRNRKEDISMMTHFFAEKYSKLFNKGKVKFTSEALDVINNYDWPGNVRELENALEYTMNMVSPNGNIRIDNLPKKILEDAEDKNDSLFLEDIEKKYIQKALNLYVNHEDQKQRSAEALGIGIATLYRKIKKYELE